MESIINHKLAIAFIEIENNFSFEISLKTSTNIKKIEINIETRKSEIGPPVQ
jgi:hypothetical protein